VQLSDSFPIDVFSSFFTGASIAHEIELMANKSTVNRAMEALIFSRERVSTLCIKVKIDAVFLGKCIHL
jgi:hypothetical protein